MDQFDESVGNFGFKDGGFGQVTVVSNLVECRLRRRLRFWRAWLER